MKRQVVETIIGAPTMDGAGVHLIRVLGPNEVQRFDPFLMLDAFDSHNPDEYVKGFPFHPHRGIETVTYLMKGHIDHEDSLGNKGTIRDGQSQWMTAGSGIIHQEMPKPSEHLLGLQLWINLPQNEKMIEPSYFDITAEMIKKVDEPFGSVRVISGEYKGNKSIEPPHVQATLMDVEIKPDQSFLLPTDKEANLFVYVVNGSGHFGGDENRLTRNKLAVRFDMKDEFYVRAGKGGIRFVLFAARPLKEPISWGGPIVMNSNEELENAFKELRLGTFIKHK